MNREIKFRALLKDTDRTKGLFIIGYYFKTKDIPASITLSNGSSHEIQEDTLSQYTGLKDKNNKEIYEGDIVRRNVYTVASGKTEMSKPYEIIWDDEKAGFEYKTDGYQSGLFYEVHEIIGNIYENPDLLSTQSVDKK